MQFSIQAITLFSLVAAAAAAPDGLRLDNGQETVDVTVGSPKRGLSERGNLSCKGSAFCERLGSSCDDAFRQIEPGKYV